MSGFEQESNQRELREYLHEHASGLLGDVVILNDSVGSVHTASAEGGMVIISGTGSIGQYIAPNGTSTRTGGWGHMIGDEGGAYNIAARGIGGIFRALDGYAEDGEELPDVERALALLKAYFKLEHPDGLLEHMYTRFKKSHVAGFTRELSRAASEGDAFCATLFHVAGRQLGTMARTLAPFVYASKAAAGEALPASGELPPVALICEGSVWQSWPLLQAGFVEAAFAPATTAAAQYRRQAAGTASHAQEAGAVRPPLAPGVVPRLTALRLLRLQETCAVGAAWHAAQSTGHAVTLDRSELVQTLCELEAGGTAAAPTPAV